MSDVTNLPLTCNTTSGGSKGGRGPPLVWDCPLGPHLSFTHRDKIDIRPLLLYSEMNMHSKLYNKLLHELSLLASGPENVSRSLAYCTKSRAQVNKSVRCLDSCLPNDNPGPRLPLDCISVEPPLSTTDANEKHYRYSTTQV